MKKLLSILLTLTMMISLVAAFYTVSFAEETTTEISRTEFTDDEWNATDEGFSLNMYEAESRSRLGQPDNNGKWDKEAIEWLTKNGYAGYADDGARYYLTKNENGGYDISKTVDSNKPSYMIFGANARMNMLKIVHSQINGEIIIGGNWLGSALNSHRINKFPYDFDIKLGTEKHKISGVRMYESHYGDGSTTTGSWVTDYDIFVKFVGDNDYTKIANGTNDKKQVVEVNFGYNVEVTDVRIRVNKCSGSAYYTSGGFTVLKPVDGMDTYTSDAERKNALAGEMIDTRVIGSLENKKTIVAAENKYGEAAVETYKSAYNAKAVKELDVAFGTVTATSPHKLGDVPGIQWDGNANYYGGEKLTDGQVSPDDLGSTSPSAYYGAVDYAVYPTGNQYLTITLPVTDNEPFTGIRFYSRKSAQYNYYQRDNSPKKAEITLYGDDGTTYVTSGTLTAETSVEKGPAYEGKDYTNYRYVDIDLNYNGATVRVEKVTKIVVVVKELWGGNHWGSEEIRLIDDSGVKTTKTVADIAKESVSLEMKEPESGVYADETGIIRFITEFKNIADGAKIEKFGTYVIRGDKFEAANVKDNGDNVGVYTGENPVAGNTFSVDVQNIESKNFSVPVTAISFVKIEGYDNLIVTQAKTNVTVTESNKLK